MQGILVNIATLGLFVFLFASISWLRKDDRLRCWTLGWLCILGHFGVELWQPSGADWQGVQSSISVDALALAGIFFVISTFVLDGGRKAALLVIGVIGIPTLICLNLAIIGMPGIWPLAA